MTPKHQIWHHRCPDYGLTTENVMSVFPELAPRPGGAGGFQTTLSWDSPRLIGHPLMNLQEYLHQQFNPAISSIQGFINVNYQTDQPTEWHSHPEIPGQTVAVVYLFSPRGSGGELEFRDPSYQHRPGSSNSVILFPAAWEHRVLPYRNYFRLSLVFNIGLSL